MGSISNRFYVTALEDGTTLHGNLSSDKPLSQAWNGSSAVPNWQQSAEQPTIYLTLLSGGSLVQPAVGFKWYYKGTEIDFTQDTRFQQTTYPVTYGSDTLNMPAIKIVDNLATSQNVDVDLITFTGEYVINGASIPFSCTAQIRISAITANDKLGLINFAGGIANITQPNQIITLYGKVYNSSGGEITTATTKWYFNDSQSYTAGADKTVDGTTYRNAYQVYENEAQAQAAGATGRYVLDHATVRCEFYDADGNLLYTAYESIDDMQDPEFMYIQYNGANGNAASLRKDEYVEFSIWVGRREDPSVLGGTADPIYKTYKVKLLDGDGIQIGGTADPSSRTSVSGFNNAGADGYRNLDVSGGKASVTVTYAVVNSEQYGKRNLTGIVLATTDAPASTPTT